MRYKLDNPQVIYELGERTNQEDAIFPKAGQATEHDRLFIVCDGMGGHEAGEVASNAVCQAMGSFILKQYTLEEEFTNDDLLAALNAAYDVLDSKDNGAEKKMGTTLVFLKFHQSGCMAAHIGDSRIYHIRPASKEILYKSRDHSLVNDLYDIGEITLEEMKTSRQKNVITRAMQPNQEKRAKADIKQITDIQPGDYFYLCSDGMLEETEDDELLNILCMETNDKEKICILKEVSKSNRDNHSAYLVRVSEVISEENKKQILSAETPDGFLQPATTNDSPAKRESTSKFKIALFTIALFAIMYLIALLILKYNLCMANLIRKWI